MQRQFISGRRLSATIAVLLVTIRAANPALACSPIPEEAYIYPSDGTIPTNAVFWHLNGVTGLELRSNGSVMESVADQVGSDLVRLTPAAPLAPGATLEVWNDWIQEPLRTYTVGPDADTTPPAVEVVAIDYHAETQIYTGGNCSANWHSISVQVTELNSLVLLSDAALVTGAALPSEILGFGLEPGRVTTDVESRGARQFAVHVIDEAGHVAGPHITDELVLPTALDGCQSTRPSFVVTFALLGLALSRRRRVAL